MVIKIDPTPKHRISKYIYMQFMEPLGTADSSVDAAWDYVKECWRPDVVDLAAELAPTMIRWGGCFASYYHWKEAVGPMERRVPMLNQCWDGMFSNHVGTAEVIDFCRRVGADPLITVNMESDGRMCWAYPRVGEERLGTAEEAAEWVDYCNNPDNPLRIAHGDREPYNVKFWQIGNETSYDKEGFSCEEAVERTKRFARSMKEADPSVKLIAWGDNEWAAPMCEALGDDIDIISFHEHFFYGFDSPLFNYGYRDDLRATWDILMKSHEMLQKKIDKLSREVAPYGKKLAITECHYDIKGKDRCDLLSTWMAGVAYARCLNVMERNSDIVDIATMADFMGNRWQVNAMMIPTPYKKRKPYLQPVGTVMSLFRHHIGEMAVNLDCADGLDIAASRTGNTLYLHIANVNMDKPVSARIQIDNMKITGGCAYEITSDLTTEITEYNPVIFKPIEKHITGDEWVFPPASVTAMELIMKPVDKE